VALLGKKYYVAGMLAVMRKTLKYISKNASRMTPYISDAQAAGISECANGLNACLGLFESWTPPV
jgi:hypothetical protein